MKSRSLADPAGSVGRASGPAGGGRRPAFLIRLTPLGGVYLFLCLIAAGSATNTGNNGMFMVAALFLGTLAASGFVSRRNLWRVSAGLEPPDDVFAGREVLLTYRFRGIGGGASRAVRVEVEGAAEGDPSVPPVLIGELPAGTTVRVEVAREFPSRGRQSAGSVFVSSLFPFGLFRKGRRLRLPIELVVYPQIVPVAPEALKRAASGAGDVTSRRRGRSGEADGMRDFQTGDDPRDIHWKQSARHRHLILKQRLEEGAGWTTIVIDPGTVSPERFESLVSAAASLALALLEAGRSVSLRTGRLLVPPAAGRDQRRRLLDSLAVLAPDDNPVPVTFEPPAAGEVRIRAEEIPC